MASAKPARIELRLMAAALLFHGDDLLMMKRSERRTLSPGMWGVVGGHVEPGELAHPKATCLREIREETGFPEEDIERLELRYILLRNNRGEYRQQFIYAGTVRRRDFTDTEEGELHWVPKSEVLDPQRRLPYIFRATLEHYFTHPDSPHVWMGLATKETETGRPQVVWTPVADPEV